MTPSERIEADLVLEGASEVVTCAPSALGRGQPGGFAQGECGAIPNGAVACDGEKIVFVGETEECRRRIVLRPGGRRIDLGGRTVLPGFIDPHTHIPFAGWRAEEFEERLAGASYAEIAAAGGGILSTVRATREAGPERLAALVRERLDAMLESGTTTAEAKSGYGLSLDSELEILRALALAADHPVEIVPTLLGAHVVGPEYRDGRRSEYVRLVAEEMVPRVAREGLARFCDVFVDKGAFTIDEARTILEAARRAGLGIRVHAEQLSRTGASALAAALGASSVDHLERAGAREVEALAATWRGSPDAGGRGGDRPSDRSRPPVAGGMRGTVAVLLPGAALYLGEVSRGDGCGSEREASREPGRPPARALIEAGVPVAIATDFNPGTSPCHAMPTMISLACLLFGLTPDEAIVAATRCAALSLGIEDRVGSVAPGMQADIAIFDVPDRRHLAYRLGPLRCSFVVKRGKVVVEEGRLVRGGADLGIGRSGESAKPARGPMLVEQTLEGFLETLANNAPVPGGGSASALAGAQAAALLQMVVALTVRSEKFAASRPTLEPIGAKAREIGASLAGLVDRDAAAYGEVVAAMRMPKETAEQKEARRVARAKAFMRAAEVPLETAGRAAAIADLAAEAASHVNPNAASDLLVAALLADAALQGAAANVRINLGSIDSEEFAKRASEQLAAWAESTSAALSSIKARFAESLPPPPPARGAP